MKNGIRYKDGWILRSSEAYTLWEESEKSPAARKKFEDHMKDVEARYNTLHGGPLAAHLVDYAIGNMNGNKENSSTH